MHFSGKTNCSYGETNMIQNEIIVKASEKVKALSIECAYTTVCLHAFSYLGVYIAYWYARHIVSHDVTTFLKPVRTLPWDEFQNHTLWYVDNEGKNILFKVNKEDGGIENSKWHIKRTFCWASIIALMQILPLSIPYCYYYLRVLCFASFCDLEKSQIKYPQKFLPTIRHSGVYTITNCGSDVFVLEHA